MRKYYIVFNVITKVNRNIPLQYHSTRFGYAEKVTESVIARWTREYLASEVSSPLDTVTIVNWKEVEDD